MITKENKNCKHQFINGKWEQISENKKQLIRRCRKCNFKIYLWVENNKLIVKNK